MPADDVREEVNARLAALGRDQEERLAQHRARMLRLPYVSLTSWPLESEALALVPREVAAQVGAVIFYKRGRDVRLGVVNPARDDFAAWLAEWQVKAGVTPQLFVISRRSLVTALARYAPPTAAAAAKDEMVLDVAALSTSGARMANLEELGQSIERISPGEILAAVVAGALRLNASDIHVEPTREAARLRYRIDGVLHDAATFGLEGWRRILSRVKVLAALKLNVRSVPQDGSFVLKVDGQVFDVRVSTLPGAFGENVVMRLFSRQEAESFRLATLGMKERDLAIVRAGLRQSTGMVVAAGPTGSGKTTTIAACVREVNRPELKIITLEDPIEYRLPGVEQTEVDVRRGYTFAVGLRSILRQDPDIIFVGEMRDLETAETSVHASMTGHLVFSTVHANDAAGVILRIIDLGIKPYVLAPALNVVISQRLVRKVCTACAEPYPVTPAQREHVQQVMRGVAPDVFDPRRLAAKLTFVKARGCAVCAGTGYQGRTGVFEVFAVRDELEELVLQGADSNAIKAAAVRGGMTTVLQDAYLKVLDQITTVEEVARISEE